MSQGKTRDKLFSFVVNDDERKALEELAAKLERTKSDALRVALRSAVSAVRRADVEEMHQHRVTDVQHEINRLGVDA